MVGNLWLVIVSIWLNWPLYTQYVWNIENERPIISSSLRPRARTKGVDVWKEVTSACEQAGSCEFGFLAL